MQGEGMEEVRKSKTKLDKTNENKKQEEVKLSKDPVNDLMKQTKEKWDARKRE
jgi:hypothetical protein